MQSEFQTLATHLAGKDVNLVFESKKGAVPRVEQGPESERDSKPTVYLPTSLNRKFIYPTIAATLHETRHVKSTDFKEYKLLINSMIAKSKSHVVTKFADHIVNVCEDIRIDTQVFGEFCNGQALYGFLLREAMELKAEVKDDPINHFAPLLLDYIYMRAVGYDQYFDKKEAKKLFESKHFIDDIDLAITVCKTSLITQAINPACVSIALMIEKFYNSQAAKNQMKQRKQEKLLALRKEYGAAQKKSRDSYAKKGEAEEEFNEVNSKYRKAATERDDHRSKLFKENKSWQDIENDETYLKLSKKVVRANEKLKEAEDALDKARDEFNQDNLKSSSLKSSIDRSEMNFDDDEEVLEELEKDSYGYGKGNMGFDCINRLFKLSKTEKMPIFTDNIQTIFSRMVSKPVNEELTGKINVKNIYKIFSSENTDISDIFKTNRFRSSYNNKLVVLMDVSGSMRGKYKLLFNTVQSLLKIVDANKEAYNVDYAVATYSWNAKFFKKFGEEKKIDFDNMFSQFMYDGYIMNGGTEIIGALNQVQEHIDMESTHKDNKYIVVFTDCVFGEYDMKVILDKFNAEREKIIFIGLGSEKRFREQYITNKWSSDITKNTNKMFFEKILMKRMVNSAPQLEKVLLDGFDRIIDRN